jgi:hypothetical protein
MIDSKDKASKKPSKKPDGLRPEQALYERERSQFKALLLGNPNYFGNLKESQFQPVLKIQGNTTYEEIGCVGFQPQFNRLEAVVFVKQQGGYGGGLCTDGTQEYVRFYLSYDNGATWEDQGVTSFTAYDLPHEQRLEYAVSLDIKPRRRICLINNIVLVRAILSWNVEPPPNSPDVPPVWGNVHDTHILTDPLFRANLKDFLDELEVKVPEEVLSVINLTQEVEAAQPQTLGAAELQKLYAKTNVEPHRFALSEVQRLLEQPLSASLLAGGAEALADLKLDLSAIAGQLAAANGNTTYEQLECVGLNPNLDTLVGTIRVKLPNGYSGKLCSAGSREYVAFWADFDNDGTFDTYLGTTSVRVHDIADLPKEGLEYAVFLPADLTQWRRPCKAGPVLIRVRAVLSWNVPPSTVNPDAAPVWGNHEDTLVHIRPGRQTNPGTHTPFIETVGGMRVARIDNATGLANGAADTAGFTAIDSPFGGEVIIAGHIAYPTNISGGAAPLKYKVSVSSDGGATWQARTDTFTVGRTQIVNGIPTPLLDATQSVDAENFYEYREDLTGGGPDALIFVTGNVLFRWNTNGLTGLWKIKIEAKDPAVPGPVFTSNVVTVRLDSLAPVLGLDITSGGGVCADFNIGDQISGTYSAFDEHLFSLSLVVEPTLGGKFTAPPSVPAGPPAMPLSRTYPVALWTGEAGNWTLDTTGMPRCGYIIRLSASDRTIVNSGFVGRGNSKVVGLCLRQPGK